MPCGFESHLSHQKKQRVPLVPSVFLCRDGTRRGRPCLRQGSQVSSEHLARPWESPAASRRIPERMGMEAAFSQCREGHPYGWCFFVQRWAWSDPALPPAICEPLKESPFSPQVCPLFHDSRIRFRLRVIVPAAV